MKKQMERGGGSVCIENANLWHQLRTGIKDIEPCPTASSVSSSSSPYRDLLLIISLSSVYLLF